MRIGAAAGPPRDNSLAGHLLGECLAMAKYALASGLKVPPGLMQTLNDLADRFQIEPVGGTNREGPDPGLAKQDSSDTSKAPDQMVQKLTRIHSLLAEILAPSSPRTVLLLENESRIGGVWGFIGPVGLIRRLMVLALLFLAAFILLSISPLVNSISISRGIFESGGLVLLFNLLFLLSAAGLGACFAGLFLANRYIANNTFDPKYEASYWIRIVLGLMAGIILAELIPLDLLGGTGSLAAASGTGAEHTTASAVNTLGKPVLALLGGFSAAAVYRVISKIVDALESLVRGDNRENAAVLDQATKAQYQSQLAAQRLTLAANLTGIQQKIDRTGDSEELKRELDRVVSGLLPQNNFEDQIQAG